MGEEVSEGCLKAMVVVGGSPMKSGVDLGGDRDVKVPVLM